jgi:hypothetical protein
MNDIYLDFEAPIAELQKKIDELEKLSSLNNIDVSKEVQALTGRLKEMMAGIYAQLTPWQRVQLSRHPRRPYALDYINMLCTNFISPLQEIIPFDSGVTQCTRGRRATLSITRSEIIYYVRFKFIFHIGHIQWQIELLRTTFSRSHKNFITNSI